MEAAAEPLIPPAVPPPAPSQISHPKPKTRIPWIPLAAASGACAAINGVFAKLTTTELTSSWAAAISSFLSLSSHNAFIEFLIRASFFTLNLLFNFLMWTLFTAALTRSSSTTRVSIINTSANFMITALAGWIVFGEQLNGLWWVGAGGLVVGNVVIGRRGEEEEKGEGGEEERREGYRDEEREEGGGISDGVTVELVEGRGGKAEVGDGSGVQR
ncbi:hypothetical protein JMJ35_005151 [Cladonia borealis]|uniref:EamA domain-containing protein n=1 Tax=Cladonia borealis TaxID=184061 RepID=A0AA39V194_9LECA|nr:hypothetical protein JMJ35_005151 [Cladonia borealis]